MSEAQLSFLVANDHAGLPLVATVMAALQAAGCTVEHLGTREGTSVDYPDFAHALSCRVADGSAFGVLICGSGVGMSIAANRHVGVRAVVCSESYSAIMARRHNDANVLCLGARVIGAGVAEEIVRAFVATQFEGGRHAQRVLKIETR